MDVPTPRPAGATGAAPAGRPLVVVGIDGSDGSRAALRYALAAAARRQAELEVIAARPPRRWAWESEDDPPGLTAELADLRERADAFWAEVRAGAPEAEDVPVHVLTVAGHPGDLLVEAAEQADLLVVGSRGRGAVRSALLGSVALHCVTDAPCPVAVVHPTGDRAGGPVLAAVDAAPSGRAVLAAALDEAARLGVRLDVLTAYQGDDSWTDVVATRGSQRRRGARGAPVPGGRGGGPGAAGGGAAAGGPAARGPDRGRARRPGRRARRALGCRAADRGRQLRPRPAARPGPSGRSRLRYRRAGPPCPVLVVHPGRGRCSRTDPRARPRRGPWAELPTTISSAAPERSSSASAGASSTASVRTSGSRSPSRGAASCRTWATTSSTRDRSAASTSSSLGPADRPPRLSTSSRPGRR